MPYFKREIIKKCFLFGVAPLQSKLTAIHIQTDPLYKWKSYIFRMKCFFFWSTQQTHDIPVVVGKYDTVSAHYKELYSHIYAVRLLYLHVGKCVCLDAHLVYGEW